MDNVIYDSVTPLKSREGIRKPGFCCLGIVDTCMLKCQMCDKWKEDLAATGDMPTTDDYKKFLTQLREIVDEGFELSIGGGEALMRPDLLEIIRFAADLGYKTTIASNGWLVDDAFAKKIVDSGLTSIIFSVDSLKPEVHDGMRGREGVWDRVMSAMKNIRKHSADIHIGLCSIIMEETIDGILDLADWSDARRDLINSHLFMAVMQPNNTVCQDEWFEHEDLGKIWPKDPTRTLSILDELIRRRREGYWIGNSVQQLEAFKAYFQHPTKFVKNTECNLDSALHVSAVGDIFMCFKWAILGNIKRGADVRDVWYSEEAEKTREDIRNCKDNCHYLLNCYFEGDYPFEVWDGR